MKKVMFLALAIVLFAGNVLAQTPQSGESSLNRNRDRGPVNREQRMKMRMERLNQQLNLNDEQKKKVEALFTDEETQMNKLREQQSDNREQNRSAFEKMRTEREAKMKDILTPDQFTKYTEMNKNMGPRPGGLGNRQQDQVKEKAAEVKDDASKEKAAITEKAKAKKAKKEAKLKKAAEEVK